MLFWKVNMLHDLFHLQHMAFGVSGSKDQELYAINNTKWQVFIKGVS